MRRRPPPDADLPGFMALSRRLTGYDDLDAGTGARIHAALTGGDPARADQFRQLATLSDSAPDAAGLRGAAVAAGLGDSLTAVVTAWYTGTVADDHGSTVITYRDALMYRPVADGLIVPTYCSKGPMWWQDTLPPGITRMPVNSPKVL